MLHLLIFISSASLSSRISHLKPSQQVTTVFETLFQNSHVDLIILQHGPFRNALSSNSEFSNTIITQIPLDMVRSIDFYSCVKVHATYNCFQKKQKRQNLWKVQKKCSGSIHAYFLPQNLDFTQASSSLANTIMEHLRKGGAWPNNFLFFMDFLTIPIQNRIHFYSTVLPGTFARGLILEVDLSSKAYHLICIPCPPDRVLTKFSSSDLWTQVKYHREVALSQLYGTFVKTIATHVDFVLLNSCDFTAFPTKAGKYTSLLCFHHFLSGKFNYTYHSISTLEFQRQGGVISHKFSVEEYRPVHPVSHSAFTTTHQYEWISHGVKFDKFHFLPMQRHPSGNVLTKPYDRVIWALISFGAACLAIVTILLQHLNHRSKPYLNNYAVIMSILATMLEQEVAKRFSKRVVFGSQILPCLWFLWIFMMIILANGYAGVLYSLMMNGETLNWPGSLYELVSDSNYCAVTSGGMIVHGLLQSILKTMLINPVINGKQGSYKFREAIKKLNKSLQFYPRNEEGFGLERQVVEGSNLARGYFKVGKEKCSKFALIEDDPREDGTFINFFLKDSVAGNMEVIAGHLTVFPLGVERNFFHQRFLSGVASLDSAGFHSASEKHTKFLFICGRIASYNGTVQRVGIVSCVQRAKESFAKGDVAVRNNHEETKPISLGKLKTTMKACLFGLAIASAVIVLERVKKLKSLMRTYFGRIDGHILKIN